MKYHGVRNSLPAKIASRTILFYQKNLSGLKSGPSCRFTPTCSQYGLQAIESYGFFRGFFLLLIRLVKCGPWHPGGWDPVTTQHEFHS